MTPAGDMARVLRAYVDAYLQEIGQLTYADLCAVQEPPHASVAYGAAGVAYALCRAGETLANRELLRQAWRWAGWARDGARRRGAFDDPGDARRVSRHALFYGRLGIHAVRARIAHAQRRRAAFRREVAGYSRCWRRGPDRPLDLVEGVAGQLAGAAPLLLIEPNAPLRRLAAARAAALAERARAWTPSRDDTSFAHGWPGGAYALLRWFYSLGQEVPQWLVARCLRLCDLRPAYGLALEPRRPRYLPSSWCNGAAGMTLLWVSAFEATGRPAFREAARRAGRALLSLADDGIPTLCCGAGGRAYAFLALERIDPGRWRRRAEAVAVAAVAWSRRTAWPNGLLRGHPGLVCLALDLLAPTRGFPLLED